MQKVTSSLTLAGLLIALAVGAAAGAPESASSVGCGNQLSNRAYGRSESRPPITLEFSAQTKRPRVTIYRRRAYPGPNAVRQCRSWLVTEYRISGPVIVPQMRCWWE
jgi:hypothetical protein